MVKGVIGALHHGLPYDDYLPAHPVIARRFKGDSIMWPYIRA